MSKTTRRGWPAPALLLGAMALLSSCSHQGGGGPAPGSATPAPASAVTASATNQYLSTSDGKSAVELDQLVPRLAGRAATSGCAVSAHSLVRLGSFDEIASSIGAVPDPVLEQLLTDELSDIGQALADCRGNVAVLRRLSTVHKAVDQRLSADGYGS